MNYFYTVMLTGMLGSSLQIEACFCFFKSKKQLIAGMVTAMGPHEAVVHLRSKTEDYVSKHKISRKDAQTIHAEIKARRAKDEAWNKSIEEILKRSELQRRASLILALGLKEIHAERKIKKLKDIGRLPSAVARGFFAEKEEPIAANGLPVDKPEPALPESTLSLEQQTDSLKLEDV